MATNRHNGKTAAQRWRGAMHAVIASGVQVAGNINSCCAGCIDRDKDLFAGWDGDAPYIGWLSTQGRAIRFYRDGSFKPDQGGFGWTKGGHRRWLNWSNMSQEQVRAVCKIIRSFGFYVKTPKSRAEAIEVRFEVRHD